MEEKNTRFKDFLVALVAIPCFILFSLGLLLYTPIDYIQYKCSRYYKDTKEKYEWFCTTVAHVKFYNFIKKENLPIAYYHRENSSKTEDAFFVYKDTLIIHDYVLCYDKETAAWLIDTEEDTLSLKEDVESTIAKCNTLLEKDVCKKAVVLIGKDVYEQHPTVEYDHITFLPVRSALDLEAIKTILN